MLVCPWYLVGSGSLWGLVTMLLLTALDNHIPPNTDAAAFLPIYTFRSNHWSPNHASVFTWGIIFQEMNFWLSFCYLLDNVSEGTWKTVKCFALSDSSLLLSLFWRQRERAGLLWTLFGVTVSNHLTFWGLSFLVWGMGNYNRVYFQSDFECSWRW